MQFFEYSLFNDEKWRKNAIVWMFWIRWKMKKMKQLMQFFECFLLNAMKNEENNAIFWMFLVECNEKW
jgi:hypothetical protein